MAGLVAAPFQVLILTLTALIPQAKGRAGHETRGEILNETIP
jgi:hypothetical protein